MERENPEPLRASLTRVKTPLVGALFLLVVVLLGLGAVGRLCYEMVGYRAQHLVTSWTASVSNRTRAVLQEGHLPTAAERDASFDAYELIRNHTASGDKVYLLRRFDLPALGAFYRVMTLAYPREVFPVRELDKNWVPQDRRHGQRVFVLDYRSRLKSGSDPRFTSIASRGSCTLWAYSDTN